MLEGRLALAGGRAERGRILGRALIDLLQTAVQDRVSEPHLRRRTRWADPQYRRATSMGYRVESWLQDVRYGLRSMRRAPGVTALLVLTIAAGIGPNVAIFSVVEVALLRCPTMTLAVRHWGI